MSTDLPGLLGEIAEVIGEVKAMQIARELGGHEVYFALKPGPDSPLARVVGIDDAVLLAREIGNLRLIIPLGGQSRAARCKRMLQEGLPHSRIATACGLTLGAVQYHAKKLGLVLDEDPRQGKLDL